MDNTAIYLGRLQKRLNYYGVDIVMGLVVKRQIQDDTMINYMNILFTKCLHNEKNLDLFNKIVKELETKQGFQYIATQVKCAKTN